MRLELSRYLVTDARLAAAAGHELPELVELAVAGGVTAVQVREKDTSSRAFLEKVLGIADRLPAEVALIVNDRIDVFLAAREAGARVTGVHVGQSDLPVATVRGLVGPDAVVGVSTSTETEVHAAAAGPAPADYVGIGPLHATPTKPDAAAPLGLARCTELVRISRLPAVVIGGVTSADLGALRAAGAAGGAVVSAICSAADPRAAAHELRAAWEEGS